MLARDYFSHVNPEGQSPTARANAAGFPGSVAENIAWGGSTGSINQIDHVFQRHAALLASPGHRQNLMNSTHEEVGTGVRYGVFTSGTNYNASMVTEVFANRAGNPFITGVAYSDAIVDDNFYTVGEGAGGILITATNDATGSSYSVTSGGSGGYTLQVPNGTYTVTALGGEIDGQVTHTGVIVSGINVKVDVVTTEGTPPQAEGEVTTNGMAIIGRRNGVWWGAASTGVNLVNQVWGSWSSHANWEDVQIADVDGDGDQDVVGRTNGRWWVARSNGLEFVNESWASWSTRVTWRDVSVGDFNGDGRDDLIGRAGNGSWWVGLSNGSSFDSENWGNWSSRIRWDNVQIGDFDGNGKDDVLGRAQNGSWWVARSTGSGFSMERWGAWSTQITWTGIDVGDFNGDGRDEVIGRAGRAWWLAESTGSSFVNRLWTVWSDSVPWENLQVGDVDGDGRDDLLGRANGQWWVTRTQDVELVNESWGSWNPNANWEDVQMTDLNGDGWLDLIGRVGSDWWVGRSNGSRFTTSLWGSWPDGDWDDVFAGFFG